MLKLTQNLVLCFLLPNVCALKGDDRDVQKATLCPDNLASHDHERGQRHLAVVRGWIDFSAEIFPSEIVHECNDLSGELPAEANVPSASVPVLCWCDLFVALLPGAGGLAENVLALCWYDCAGDICLCGHLREVQFGPHFRLERIK